jgi:hypothetical protein
MPNNNRKMQNFKKYMTKTFHKFTNYTKNQKLFTLFLLIFTVAIIICPIAKIDALDANSSNEFFWFIGKTYFKSMIIVLLSMLFLL